MVMKHKVLVLGSGGREHALAWKISLSPLLDRLFVAPGNAGTSAIATNVPLQVSDFDAVRRVVLQYGIDVLLIGPEDPLVKGLVDFCRRDPALRSLCCVGPAADAARLEGSKDFAKAFMSRHGIPTAAYRSFSADDCASARLFLKSLRPPYVLKADGLAAGKGVIIEPDLQRAEATLEEMFAGKFGHAGDRVIIEEYLDGIEMSAFVLTDGLHYKILPSAKDYKRVGEGDAGLNTGGMGAVSPVCFADPAFMDKVERRIIRPTIEALRQEDMDYRGFLFMGLMNKGGDPYVIEYNVRMGDPEAEVLMLRLQGDLLQACCALRDQSLYKVPLCESNQTALCVVAVSAGYPGACEKGKPITGLETLRDTRVFHMGTLLDSRADGGSCIRTAGGRVLALSATAPDIRQARALVYRDMEKIRFDGLRYRRDIGSDLMDYSGLMNCSGQGL